MIPTYLPHAQSEQPIERLLAWIVEREFIRKRKESGAPQPWTVDSALAQFRFCNVERENDRVTIWIKENWRDPYTDDPDLWFSMVIARIFNLPPTLKELGYPIPWDGNFALELMNRYTATKKQIFNGAYIISTNGNAMPKNQYIVEKVLNPLWNARNKIRPDFPFKETLASFHKRLTNYDGLGSFMAAQVIADLKYTQNYVKAKDWETFAASGPGSRRGLNRLMSRSLDAPMPPSVWLGNINHFRKIVNQSLAEYNDRLMMELGQEGDLPENLHAQDFQNCLCEFDKWERVHKENRRAKQIYRPNRHKF